MIHSALGRRGAVRWRLLRPFRRRFSFSGAAPEPPFWVAGSIVSPNREHLYEGAVIRTILPGRCGLKPSLRHVKAPPGLLMPGRGRVHDCRCALWIVAP